MRGGSPRLGELQAPPLGQVKAPQRVPVEDKIGAKRKSSSITCVYQMAATKRHWESETNIDTGVYKTGYARVINRLGHVSWRRPLGRSGRQLIYKQGAFNGTLSFHEGG